MGDQIADFQAAFDILPAPAFLLDCELNIKACNIAGERMAHRSRTLLLERPLFEVFPGWGPQQKDVLVKSFKRVIRTRKSHSIPEFQYDLSMSSPQGFHKRRWTVSNLPLMAGDGTLAGILHCPVDITQSTQLTLQMKTSFEGEAGVETLTRDVQSILHVERERFQQLFRQAPGFICVLKGPEHVFELANDAYYQLVGHREVIGHVVAEVLPEVISQGFLNKLDRVYRTGEPFIGRALPIELQRVAGGDLELRYIDLIFQPILDVDRKVTGIFVQGNDVTEAYHLTQEVAYQAAHDSLTDLCSRREFTRQTRTIEGKGPHALLYMDIDHFKIVNDPCGQAAGDSLLQEVASVLKTLCRDDDLLGRLGGDAFALMRRNCDSAAAMDLAHQLRRSVQALNFVWQGKRYGVTMSVGVVGFGVSEGISFEKALGLADAACFLAKEQGRNRVQLSLRSDEEVRRQQSDMDTVTRIKDAMRDNRIVLFGQRLFDLHGKGSDNTTSYEVLARLRDTNGDLVEPAGFIPAAERFGVIEELDRHIVRQSFAHLEGQANRRRVCYFINLSGMTLSSAGFPKFIENLLAAYPSIAPAQICFEVTETAAVSNIGRTAAAMCKLAERGFRFALDDFGSGMASFSYLQHLPVQFVKIDGAFVNAILNDPTSAIIVESFSKVACSMNMRTIAESVDTQALLPKLRQLGIHHGQGYALHRPEPLDHAIMFAPAKDPIPGGLSTDQKRRARC